MTDQLAHKAARAELVVRVLIVLAAAILVGSFGVGTAVLVKVSHVTDSIRQTQKTNTSVNATNTQLLTIIHSCLTPSGACYKLGEAQRATAAQGVQQTTAAAAACAANLPHPTYGAVYHCVQTALGEKGTP